MIPASRTTDPLLAALDALQADVRELRQRVAVLESQRRPRADATRDDRLLSAVAAAFGASVFAAKDLHEARHDPELAAVLDGASVRVIGGWLRRLHGRPTAPYQLRRVGREGSGALWELSVSDNIHTSRRQEHARRRTLAP